MGAVFQLVPGLGPAKGKAMSEKPTQKTSYQWCLYILILVVGYWIGQAMSEKPTWFYMGPDPSKADQACISILLTEAKP